MRWGPLLVCLLAVAAGCGNGGSGRAEGRYASFYATPDQLSKFEAWRSPTGTLYLRERQIVFSCPPGAACPSQHGYGAGPFAIRGRRVFGLDFRGRRHLSLTAKRPLVKLFYEGIGPDPLALERELRAGTVRPAPDWAKPLERSLRRP
jgi:hypothetical protein